MLSNTGINKVILLGTAMPPFVEKVAKGQKFLCFDLVTTEHIKKGYDLIEHNEFHKVKIPEKLVEQDSIQLVEGITLFVEGKIQTTAFTDDQNIKRYNLEIIAVKVDVLGTIPVSMLK